MAKAGSVLDNPITGEHYVMIETARETDGKRLVFELNIPKGFKVIPHIHPIETETLSITQGRMKIMLNGVEQTVNPGEKVVIHPNVQHVWWNDTPDGGKLQFIEELAPALGWETLFEQIFGLSQDGKANKDGVPSLPQIALSLNEYKQHVWFIAPIWLQRIVIPFFALIGRLQGLKPWYDKYSPEGAIPPNGINPRH